MLADRGTATLRRARRGDVAAMHALDLVCFAEPFRFSLRSIRRFATQAGAISLVAECEGALLGFAIVSVRGRGGSVTAYVTTLDVHPDHRRAGLARALMAEAERQAMAAGATEIGLHVHRGNDAAVRFYEAGEYRRVSQAEDYYGPGLDAWVYLKSLEYPPSP